MIAMTASFGSTAGKDDRPGGVPPSSLLGSIATTDILEALPEPVYVVDPDGIILFRNRAAATLWGEAEDPAPDRFGFRALYRPDGTAIAAHDRPMAVALRDRKALREVPIIAERADGSRLHLLAFPAPLFDEQGVLVGGVDMLLDVTGRKEAENAVQRLAAIVESSDDAILAKDLNGVINSWNRGAERLFGYTAAEAIGRSVTMLIPLDRQDEEPEILARIRRGEHVDHFETIRRRKDGSLVEISLTISPVKNRAGTIVGASKIARDITERRRAEEQQALLIREMDHRVKNLFALAGGVVALSARSSRSAADLADAVQSRLAALAKAHALTVPHATATGERVQQATTLHALIRTILAPYDAGPASGRLSLAGHDLPISGPALTSFALLLHEFATNAAKYGALSVEEGRVDIVCETDGDAVRLTWTENGGPPVRDAGEATGFGTRLARATVQGQLGGAIGREWREEGLVIRLTALRSRLDPGA
jgi:PAS domain S-box-containing protein